MQLITDFKNIAIGSYKILQLQKEWCAYIGNSFKTFLIALSINLLAIPIWIFLVPDVAKNTSNLMPTQQAIIEVVLQVILVLSVYLMALAHRRQKKFALIYAGQTYATLLITVILFAVEGFMRIYEGSLYALDAPLFARGVLMLAAIWVVVAMSFVFKSALKINAAISLLMASVLLFILIAGELLLHMLLFAQ